MRCSPLPVTLLIVSLEVPQTFNDLWIKMQGFGAFAISFGDSVSGLYTASIPSFDVTGLQDTFTVVVNGAYCCFWCCSICIRSKFLFGNADQRN